MRPFSLLIKPAGPDCNLRCSYCFYAGKSSLFPEAGAHRMTSEVLETLVRSYLQTPQPQHVFGWQGGEPTLMGVDFFRRATALQEQYGAPGTVVANGLQTNATLIDDEMAEHFSRYHFLLGVSLDGPAEVHDRYRIGASGGSHADVMRGIGCLQRHGVEFNILVLVSQANVHQAQRIYRTLCDQGFLHHQYIPCVEFRPDGSLQPYSISGEEWGDFLCALYDVWRPTDTRRVSIRHLDSLFDLELTGRRSVCTLGSQCCQYLVVEHDGGLYPCDFFVSPAWRLGNVRATAWETALDSPLYHAFGAQKSQWNAACVSCRWQKWCMGDCLKHRLYGSHPVPQTRSVFCTGIQRFLAHAMPGMQELVAAYRREQQAQPASGRGPASGAPGRNDSCPCGSGRKFKRCCGSGLPTRSA